MTEPREVGVYEAKTHLPRLLDAVEHGETITITRHGRPIAKIVPMDERKMSTKEAIEGLIAFGQKHSLDGLKIKDLINEGRKY
jgi:prevent-host-death family protein